jgi:hypothetical protein
VCGSTDCVYNGTGCSTQCGAYSQADERGFGFVMNYYYYCYYYYFFFFLNRICSSPSSECDGREVQNIPINKCGEECSYDPILNKCVAQCITPYIRNATSGACQQAPCGQLLPD